MPQVDTNRYGVDPVSFTGNNETWIVLPGITVWGTNNGVSAGYTGNTLINRGHIVGEVIGVSSSDDTTMTNAATGSIYGDTYGVRFVSATSKGVLNNSGHIFSPGNAVHFSSGVMGAKVVNHGDIVGMSCAVAMGDAFDDSQIINFARMRSDDIGIQVGSGYDKTVVITNQAGGLIAGANAALVSFTTGAVALTNKGTIRGAIDLDSSVKDKIINTGVIQGPVMLGSGDDTFNGNGGRSGKVFGEVGLDKLFGGNFADRLNGGADRDTLMGRGGPDRFDFDAFTDSTVGNADLIADFKHGQHDRIDFADASGGVLIFRGKAAFTGTTPEVRYQLINPAGTANDRARIFVDYDGNGTPDMQVDLKGLHNLVAADFIL